MAISDAPSLVPPIEHAPLAAAGRFEPEQRGHRKLRRAAPAPAGERQQIEPLVALDRVILVLFAFNVALIGARSEVVRYLPQTASLFAAVGLPVNLRNLKFENVRIVKETQDGVLS